MTELLQVSLSINIPQEDLEFAISNVSEEVSTAVGNLSFPFDIKIIGEDLQLNGITRNQAIRDFKVDNKPLSEVLTAMVMKANPITTVKEPSELDQKLIWVVGPDPADASREIILITTRDGATKKNYQLPPPFQPKS